MLRASVRSTRLVIILRNIFRIWKKGVSGAAPITHFNAEKIQDPIRLEVKNYDPSQYFDRKRSANTTSSPSMPLIAATQAVEDSALDLEKVDKEQVGVIWSLGHRRYQIPSSMNV